MCRHLPRLGDLVGHLGRRQQSAMAGLGALAQLDFGHLDCIVLRLVAEALRVEIAVLVARPEIARAKFPHHIAAMLEVVFGEATLTRVVIEIADLRAQVECLDRMVAKRAEAHRADVQSGGIVGLAALIGADMHPRALGCLGVRIDRVAQRLVFFRIDVELGAEGVRVFLLLGAGIDQRARNPIERAAFQRAFDDIAAQERAQILEQPAEARGQRVIATQRMGGLHHVPQRDQQQRDGYDETPEETFVHPEPKDRQGSGQRQRHPKAQISLEALVRNQSAHAQSLTLSLPRSMRSAVLRTEAERPRFNLPSPGFRRAGCGKTPGDYSAGL